MAVVVVGLHERDVPLEVFEEAAVAEADLRKALAQLVAGANVSEAVILSTCLRTEVYASVDRFHDAVEEIEAFFSERLGSGGLSASSAGSRGEGERRPEAGGGVLELEGGFSCRYGDAAVSYLFEVAAGIDSPVLGEGEILRQVRDAAEVAVSEHAAGPVLGPLFRHAVEAGKRARSETAIQRGTTSLAQAAVELAADRACGFERKKIVLVGAGEMGAGMARALAGRGDLTGEVVVVNRGMDRAEEVADLLAAGTAALPALPKALIGVDVVLTSTSADAMVISVPMLEAALLGRAGPLPVVIVDLAVPRDVDPSVDALGGIVRLDVEDVRRYAEEQMAGRQGEVPAVLAILSEELDRYRASAAGRLAAPVVAALRRRAEQLRVAELDRYRSRLEALGPDAEEIVDLVTQRVTGKLLHDPTVRLKSEAGSPRGERLAEALRILFDL